MRFRLDVLIFGIAAAVAALSSCSAETPSTTNQCDAEEQRSCTCPDGSDSIQECTEDGLFGACDCPTPDADAGTDPDTGNGTDPDPDTGSENGGGDPQCVNLCQEQMTCPEDNPTSLVGTVYAPNGNLPIPNAAVYVPNDDLPPIESGAVCEQCEEQNLGSPLVGTISDYDGTFELEDVPVTDNFPLVIQLGQWRRVVEIGLDDQTDGCQTHQLDPEQTRFPTRQQETSEHDNIPKTAVSTGMVDAMECVLHQLGLEASEFSRHTQDGRIHLYRANGGVADEELAEACKHGLICTAEDCTDRDPSTCGVGEEEALLQENLSYHLYEDQQTLNSYDMVVMDCEGADHSQTPARSDDNLERIRNYVNSGGRLFASHWAYDWLHPNEELQDAAQWSETGFGSQTLAYVDNTFAGGETFWDWLQLVGADHPESGPDGQPQIAITDPRGMAQEVNDELATRWIHTDRWVHEVGYDAEQYITFNTPIYAEDDEQCGQVSYSAFHVADVRTGAGPAFPDYCGDQLTPQEMVLAYMLFDLAACVTESDTPPNPACLPLGATCEVHDQCCSNTCAIESGEELGTCIAG